MTRPVLLDLFCGAGGAARGYHDAGFEIVGVDIHPQPNYLYTFIKGDALTVLENMGWADAYHASPPCQAHSTASGRARKAGKTYPDLIAPVRALLEERGKPYVIENVVNAPLLDPVQLCGSSFELDVRRHRLFETGGGFTLADVPPCDHSWQTPRFRSLDSKARGLASVVGVHGNCNYAGEREIRERAMGIDWMTPRELTQAIPPAYTRFIGEQLMTHLLAEMAA